MSNAQKAYVFDIDGTLADNRWRAHLKPKSNIATAEEWEIYNNACTSDLVIEETADITRSLYDSDIEIIICTNRHYNASKATEDWLNANDIPYDQLIMRQDDSPKTDVEYKVEVASKVAETYKLMGWFDDLPHIVKALRAKGFIAYLVAEYACTPDTVPQDTSMGLKFDGDKVRLDLFFNGCPNAIRQVGDIMTLGAKKYADDSWQTVPNGDKRYLAALLRHLNAYASGELVDPETARSHLAHAACNAMFILELETINEKQRQATTSRSE